MAFQRGAGSIKNYNMRARRMSRETVRAHTNPFRAPNARTHAHALRSCFASFARSLARIRTCVHASRSVAGRPSCPKDVSKDPRARTRPTRKIDPRGAHTKACALLLPSTSAPDAEETGRDRTLLSRVARLAAKEHRLVQCFLLAQ